MVNWLTDWNFRKSHLITAASNAGTNYQIPITIHYGSGSDSVGNVYCNSKCKTDFADIRFTDDDGDTLLDYWMEVKVDSDYATFWVEVADTLTSNATIYIYYGNASASSISSTTNTFIRDIDSGTPCVLALPMDENTGVTAYDKSGQGNDGTLIGPTWVTGRYDYGIEFNGIDDYVEVADDASITFTSSPFTLAFWFKAGQEDTIMDILYKGLWETDGWNIMWHSSNRLYFGTFQNSANQLTRSDILIKDVWYHCVLVRDGSNATFYINGIDATYAPAIHFNPTTSTRSLKIGINDDLIIHPFKGIIDDVQIYNRALIQAEITDLYNGGQSCKLNLPMDEGTGTTTIDSSVEGNDGTLHGTTGTADAGTDATQLVDSILSATDDLYNGCSIKATSGAASGNSVLISDYNGTTKTATFATDLTGFTDGDTYEIYPAWVDGKYGKALSFDGVDDYVEVPDSLSLDITEAITISVWFKVNAWSTSGKYPTIIAKNWNTFRLYMVESDQFITFIQEFTGGSRAFKITGVLSLGQWYHLVVTYDLAFVKSYLDGVDTGYAYLENRSLVANDVPLRIGRSLSSVESFDGLIDEVRIYNRALTQAEITDLYNNTYNSGIDDMWTGRPYDTTNYAGRTLVRKYVSPEPAHSTWGNEGFSPFGALWVTEDTISMPRMNMKNVYVGISEPLTTFIGQVWIDVSGAEIVVKVRNITNTGWKTITIS